MESLYSPKSHSFSLFPKLPSSSSSFSSPSSSPILSIRTTQFLGDGHKLRLRSRRRSRRCWLHTARVPVASLNSIPVVAVVVFAALSVSAFAVVYSSFYLSKKKKEGSDDQMPGSPSSVYNQDNKDLSKPGFHRPIAAERRHTNTLEENKHPSNRFGGSSTNDEIGRVNLSSMASLVLEDMLIAKPTDLPSSKFSDNGTVTPIVPKETESLSNGTETTLNPLSVAAVAESTEVVSAHVDAFSVKDKNFGDSENDSDAYQLQNTHLDFVSTVPVIETGNISQNETDDNQLQNTYSDFMSTVPVIETGNISQNETDESQLQNTHSDFVSIVPVIETGNISQNEIDESQLQNTHSDFVSTVPVIETDNISQNETDESQLQNTHSDFMSTLPVIEPDNMTPVPVEEMEDVSVVVDTTSVKEIKHEDEKQEKDKFQFQESDFSPLSTTPTVEMKATLLSVVDTASVEDKINEESHHEHDEGELSETSSSLLPPALRVEVKDTVSTPVDSASVEDDNQEEVISEHEEHQLQTIVSSERMRSSGLYLLYEDISANDSPSVLPVLNSNVASLVNKNTSITTSNDVSRKLHRSDQSLTSVLDSTGNGRHKFFASQEGGSSQERNDFWKGKRGLRTDTLGTHRYDCERFSDEPDRKKIHINGKDSISSLMSTYNNLLKSGRLYECVELLEEMDKKDILDMNKVYHSKFFDLCRSQKAVKAALRFAKLITNPTLSTFNMLMSVCASAQDSEGAFGVMRLVRKAGFEIDCKLYTTLISTCAKSGKVDTMFEVFHEMVNRGIEPSVHTYGALIDGCARAGQVAKAFGAYGILRSKNVKPDRVVFNALISACGQCGVVERAFDVLAEMRGEVHPVDPDHVTIGALMKACTSAGQVDRVREVYDMIDKYNIRGTPELYTIAINSYSQTGDWEFTCTIYNDMKKKGVVPDEMFFSALIDAAGHAGNIDAAFEVLNDARTQGMNPGIISYSSLMGACSKTQNWEKALELFNHVKSQQLTPTVSTMNALITALCDGDQMQKAMDVFTEMKKNLGLRPNDVTYSILLAASEKNDNLEVGLILFALAKEDGVQFSLTMYKYLTRMCARKFKKASVLGEPVLSFNSGRPEIDIKWTSLALMIYRETIVIGLIPSAEMLSHVLRCLQIPQDESLKKRLLENLEIQTKTSRNSNLFSLVDGFGEYDPRAFSLFEEAASLGIVPGVSFKGSPITIDARNFNIHITEVYILTVIKGLKHRHAAGARLPSITISLPVETTEITSPNGDKTINISGRVNQAVGALLRRLRLPYLGNESLGKIRITGLAVKKWFQPKLVPSFGGKQPQLGLSQLRLAKGITHQQRNIRTGNLSLD